ncbi:MAG: UbiA family prenyltransferase [Chitinophagales bacterium]|nr:UbiA family prenyltransferase [Chitinophagales bacterium]MDW8417792.1 UbiA family prenyltransferase [Chitinophagales bacterium]
MRTGTNINLSQLLRFAFYPLWLRWKLGEGGIWIFNVLHAYFSTHDVMWAIATGLHSILTLCALYGYNDYADRYNDRLNPKKFQPFVEEINNNQQIFLIVIIFLTILSITYGLLFWKYKQSWGLFLLYIVNFAYSSFFKSLPVLDIIIVGIWGGLLTVLAPRVNLSLCVISGLMTSIAHIHQIEHDIEIDRITNVNTSAVKLRKFTLYMKNTLGLCTGYSVWLSSRSLLMAFMILIPISIGFSNQNILIKWYIWRIYFLISWIYILIHVYETKIIL